ncbi:glycosyltransferase [Salipiger bermudensis]|uniref:glycosyltransferase n=1 Tax=Salipiger bermudensis TaxID=344736 RepID=UPI001C9A13E7|nr:glycosyltransferase [Salipiger bermudensis]MBY6006628.1 glycosyltransferase [Salipiger bermudensis]
MSRPMRVLYYNWVDYLDDEKRGGGVTVYQRNLIAEADRRGDVETVFLSSGISYDLRGGAPRWERMRHGTDQDRARRYEIVNSGTLSPSHHSYGDPAQVAHAATEAVFHEFLEATGPYDVVHFNNLEGLPASVLGLKARWPDTRVVLSLHNYYPFCPQVNFWHQERETCGDYDEGRKCVHCLTHRRDTRLVRLANGLSYRLKRLGVRPGSRAFDVLFSGALRIGVRAARGVAGVKALGRRSRTRRAAPGQLTRISAPDGAPFAARRAEMVSLINRNCDAVLCVSDAVRKLAVAHGVTPEIARTSYIGSREAGAFARTEPRPFPRRDDGTLRLAYLGYMRRDKGFYFLLKALEEMPAEMAGRLRLEVAARRGDRETMDRLSDLAPHLAELTYADGYSHDDLDRLLAEVDVGLIPVLWHDNLPQVAIEMHARHIPLLCADMGGAQELGNCPEMVFKAGDVAAFHDRIAALLDGRVDMQAYWQGAMQPVDMSTHFEALLGCYDADAEAASARAAQ